MLARYPINLVVLPVHGVEWSHLGEPQRVMARRVSGSADKELTSGALVLRMDRHILLLERELNRNGPIFTTLLLTSSTPSTITSVTES